MEGQTGHSRRLASRTPETVTNYCCHHLSSCTAPAHRVTVGWEGGGHLRRCFKMLVIPLSNSSSFCFSMILFHKVEFILFSHLASLSSLNSSSVTHCLCLDSSLSRFASPSSFYLAVLLVGQCCLRAPVSAAPFRTQHTSYRAELFPS